MRKLSIISILAVITVSFGLFFLNRGKIKINGDVLIQQDSLNTLRMQVTFELNEPAQTIVKFWNSDNNIQYSEPSIASHKHSIQLVGLQENSTYNCQIILPTETGKIESSVYSFSTQKKPKTLVPIQWPKKPNNAYSGYLLTQRRLVNGSIYLIDSEGEIVWYNMVPLQPKLSHWTANNTILVLYGTARHRNSAGDHLIEYDLYGNERLNIDLKSIEQPMDAHHEVRYHPNGNLLMLVYEEKEFDLSKKGGESNQGVLGDKIILLTKEGNILWEWSVFDYSDPLQDEKILKTYEDWSHANALNIDKDGNYLVSFRNWNQVWKIDSKSGEIIWKLGQGGNLKMPESAYFSGQHAFHVNPKGDYMLFDNGREMRKTRVLSFKVDEENKSAEVRMNIPLDDDFYADRMGNAYLIENGNILVCSPRSKSIIVIDSLGNLQAHAKLGLPDPYRAEYVPSLYASHNGI